MNFKEPSSSNLYRNFRHIHQQDVYEIIRFYKKNNNALSKLSTVQRFTILCYYANALFAAEEFEDYIKTAPEILEISIIENIQFVDGKDIYLHTLEQLARAYMLQKKYDKALLIAKQLLNLSNAPKKQQQLLRKILNKQRPAWVLNAKALMVISVLILTIMEMLQIIFILPFYPIFYKVLVQIQYFGLITAIGTGLIAFLGHYIYVGRELRKHKRRKIA
jgi:tetratricopeptide (TPR) repeat protein